jgi:hypothetical protein
MSYVAVAGTVVSIGMGVIGNQASKKQAEKQRDLQKQIALTQLASDEKFAMEKLRIEQETARTGILASSLLEYRKSLQSESTARLKDTGIYVAGLGIGMGSFYGLYLMFSKD